MIQIKKMTPMRCKVLWFLGFTSISRMFASCSIGVKPYKGCKGCENNVREQIIEALCLRRAVTELDAKKGGAE